jgi:hypothetical protein
MINAYADGVGVDLPKVEGKDIKGNDVTAVELRNRIEGNALRRDV